jgi:LacI family transcriptional regulator
MVHYLHIALLIESSRRFGRELLRGIAAYSQVHGPWLFFHQERMEADPIPLALKRMKPDGILTRLAGDKLSREIRKLRIPTVDLFHEHEFRDVPCVITDHQQIARQAVRHFRERCFQNFAYCGYPQFVFSREREAFYTQELKSLGLPLHVFPASRENTRGKKAAVQSQIAENVIESHAAEDIPDLAKWLQEIPKPVALFACNDVRAHQVLNACNIHRIAVPEEVAVLGVDNDTVICELTHPQLSSIDPNAMNIGYEAAALLHRMIQGQPLPEAPLVVAPKGVVPRHSSDVLAIQDHDVANAIQHVRDHALEAVNFKKIIRELSLSRATLERWFHHYLGHSMMEEIFSMRLKRIQELLLTTSHTLEGIAQICGFAHVESMARIFKKRVGVTPGQYRRQKKTS